MRTRTKAESYQFVFITTENYVFEKKPNQYGQQNQNIRTGKTA